jgi:hypothetical protein
MDILAKRPSGSKCRGDQDLSRPATEASSAAPARTTRRQDFDRSAAVSRYFGKAHNRIVLS